MRGLGRMVQLGAVDAAGQLTRTVTTARDYQAAYETLPGTGQGEGAAQPAQQRRQLQRLAEDLPADAAQARQALDQQLSQLTDAVGKQQQFEAQQQALRGGTALSQIVAGQLASTRGDQIRSMQAADALLAATITGKTAARTQSLIFGQERGAVERFAELRPVSRDDVRRWQDRLEAIDPSELQRNALAGYQQAELPPETAQALAEFQARRAAYLQEKVLQDQTTARLAINAAADPRRALARLAGAKPTTEDVAFMRRTMPVFFARASLVAKQALRTDERSGTLSEAQRRTLSMLAGRQALDRYYMRIRRPAPGGQPEQRPVNPPRKVNPPDAASRIQRAAAQI